MPDQTQTNRRGRESMLGAQRRNGAPKPARAKRGGGSAAGSRLGQAASGLVLGVLAAMGGLELGINLIPRYAHLGEHLLPVAGLAGGVLALTRLRVLVWAAAGVTALALLLVSYTPWVQPLVQDLVRSDALAKADAVVVLAANIQPDGEPSDGSQSRLLRAYQLLGEGWAPRLVLTRLGPPRPSYVPLARRDLQRLGIRSAVEETGTVINTRDEALQVAALMKERRWKRVVLVSEPTHMRRAGATFEKAGVPVICSPSVETSYDLSTLREPDARRRAFRDWLHEAIGIRAYRQRGWI